MSNPVPQDMLTVRQPWASAMFREIGPKNIENRSWHTRTPRLVGIHAGSAVDRIGMEFLNLREISDHDKSVVLGMLEITGCHEANSRQCHWHKCLENPWAMWPTAENPVIFHWELEHPRAFVTPIRAKGALKFWQPGVTLTHLIEIAEIRPW